MSCCRLALRVAVLVVLGAAALVARTAPARADACSPNPCGVGTCTVTSGGYSCACPGGYVFDGTTCAVANECNTGANNCDPVAICNDPSPASGDYTCTCDVGWVGDGITCTDYDECSDPIFATTCDSNATCINQPGDFSCACNTGYEGDGTTCTPVGVDAGTADVDAGAAGDDAGAAGDDAGAAGDDAGGGGGGGGSDGGGGCCAAADSGAGAAAVPFLVAWLGLGLGWRRTRRL